MFFKIYIIPCLLMSPFFSLSCNSWFSIWISLEFNLMSFIPCMIFFNKFNKEISMKYFIIQTISSSILLLSTNYMMINFIEFNNLKIIIYLINLSLLIKLGSAPFHNWFINLMKNMNWINCMILSTWQKIIPLILLTYLFNYKLMFMSIILSILIGSILGINHQSIRLIMAYSSISHISWMMMNILISHYMLLIYFLSYSIINISIMSIFNNMKIFYINQLFFMNSNIKLSLLLMNMFSLTNLPPMFGFIMKWMTIYYSMWYKLNILIMMMIILSAISFIMYMRISLSSMIHINNNNKILLSLKYNYLNNKITLINMFLFSSFMNLWILSLWLI